MHANANFFYAVCKTAVIPGRPDRQNMTYYIDPYDTHMDKKLFWKNLAFSQHCDSEWSKRQNVLQFYCQSVR